MPVLVLNTGVFHRSTLHFAVARDIVYESNTWEKNLTSRKCRAYRHHHLKFVGKSHYLKRRGGKAFDSGVIVYAVISCIKEQLLYTLYPFFLPIYFFFPKIKEDNMYTITVQ